MKSVQQPLLAIIFFLTIFTGAGIAMSEPPLAPLNPPRTRYWSTDYLMDGGLKLGKSILRPLWRPRQNVHPRTFSIFKLFIMLPTMPYSPAIIIEPMPLKWILRIHLRLSRTFKTSQVHVLASDIRPNRVTNISCISIDLFLYTSNMVVIFVF